MNIEPNPKQPNTHLPTINQLGTPLIQNLQILRVILPILKTINHARIIHPPIEGIHGRGELDLPRDEGGDLGEFEGGVGMVGLEGEK